MTDLEHAKAIVSIEMRRLSKLFADNAKLTFTMRVPDDPDCFIVVTDDDIKEVGRVLSEHVDEEDLNLGKVRVL